MKKKILFLVLFVSMFSFAGVSLAQLSLQDKEFTISPNPSKSELNIKLPSAQEVRLEVFDVLGKRVYKGIISQLESTVDVSGWKSGIYLVRISNNNGTQTKRFIKQ